MPHEYCEYGPSPLECKTRLLEEDEPLYAAIYQEAEHAGEPGAAVAASSKPKAKKEAKKNLSVHIKRLDRSKRKHITVITNLQAHDIELKKAAKLFANKYACGSSVTKNPQGQEEVVVQGDVADELLEFIPATWPHVSPDMLSIVEEKAKKS